MDITSRGAGLSTFSQGLKEGGTGHTPDPLKTRRTLLIAEDNEDTAHMLREWLETNGYEVVTTTDGWEAVQLALHGHYDAVLMDMSLPTVDGMSALRLIRAHGESRQVPVVVITAYDAAYPRAEAMEAMCDEYMLKPIDFVRLEAVLQRILS